VAKYYPYGEERNAPQLPNDQVKFATYTRDSATGNDYADQRYYSSALGRFMTVDPHNGSRKRTIPASWNRYNYMLGDPINHRDPTGLDSLECFENCSDDPGDDCWIVGFDDNGDPEYECGDPGEPQQLQQPPPPQLECSFTSYAIGPGKFIPVNGVVTWVTPINLIFQATGGSGTYNFSESQTLVEIDAQNIQCSGQGCGSSYSLFSGPDKPATNLTPGTATATYSDQPGLGIQTTANFVAFSAKTLFTSVSVTSSDGQTANCGTVEWSSFVTISQQGGHEQGFGMAQIIQVFQ
jgi:RHS repeat-associated protein